LSVTCANEAPSLVGAPKCKSQSALTPLDDGCTDDVCHITVRFDYQTLGVLGWSVAGGAKHEINADEARTLVTAEFKKRNPPIRTNATLEGPNAGLYSAYAPPADFGAFALIGAQSGALAFAGSVLWSGPGRANWPSEWRPGEELACGASAAQPAETFVTTNTECGESDSPKPATPADALDTALRSNLARAIAARGPFSAAVHLYTPSVGTCDHSDIAEYLVVFTQVRE